MKELEQYSEYIISLREQGMSFQEISRKLRDEKSVDLDGSTIRKHYKEIENAAPSGHQITSVKPDTDIIKPLKQPETVVRPLPGIPTQAAEANTKRSLSPLELIELEAKKNNSERWHMSEDSNPFPWIDLLVVLLLISIALLLLWQHGDMPRVLSFFNHLYRAIKQFLFSY